MESPLTLCECRVRGTRETQRQASVLERRAVDAPARVRQPNAPLETAVRELEPANGGAARRSREPPDPGDLQDVGVECDSDVGWLDAGQGGDDRQRVVVLENVDRRLPIRHRGGVEPG